jgi:hypothetical protein
MTEEVNRSPGIFLHDWLAIGEIDQALSEDQRNPNEEIHRLPLFLRLLSAAQPLAAIPVLLPNREGSNKDVISTDPLLNSVVSKLEDVAATYSEAEGIDVLMAHHAPTVSRKLSKLPPLKRKRGEWLTLDLTTSGGIKNHRLSSQLQYNTASDSGGSDDEVGGEEFQDRFSGAEHIAVTAGTRMSSNMITPKYGKSRRISDETMLKEDSQEGLVSKTLEELTAVVVEALKPPVLDEEGNPGPLKIRADSILAEADASGVGPTLAALMHHLPVLRHEHVANAFCRANLPQASMFLLRMGQNCPTAVPAMIRGCVEAAKESPATVKTCLRTLAGLSKREAQRVCFALQQGEVLVDLQFEIALDHDVVGAASLLSRELEGTNLGPDADSATPEQNVPARHDASDVRRVSERRYSSSAGRRHSVSSSLAGAPSKTFDIILKENPALANKAYERMLEEAQTGGIGRRALFLRSLTWLVYRVGGTSHLDKIADILKEAGKEHEFFTLQLAAGLLLCARAVALDGIHESVRSQCQRVLYSLIAGPVLSLRSTVFVSRITSLLHCNDILELHALIFQTINSSPAGSITTNDEIETALNKVCIWTVSKLDLIKLMERGLTEDAILEDSSALICAITHQKMLTVEITIKSILTCPHKCQRLLGQVSVDVLIKEAAMVTVKSGAIPMVLPIELESLSRKINFFSGDWDALHAQFLLQFAYCLSVAESNPASPFSIDPRNIPAKETLRLCRKRQGLLGIDGLIGLFRKAFLTVCPDVLVDTTLSAIAQTSAAEPTMSRHEMDSLIMKSIKKCTDDPKIDPSGKEAERTFTWAKTRFLSDDVDTIAAKALLATTNAPSLYLTYSMLGRDPLVLLRCPILVWKKQGLRRIVLSILQQLLKANDHQIAQTSQTDEVAEELAASRDTILVRCLLVLTSGHEGSLHPFHCSFLTSMIRSIITKRQGLVATLAKQGHLSNCAVDFLVDFIPETMNDAVALTSLLSERSPLTAAERLRMADVALRIAIAHGSRNELEAKNLAYAALTQLTSSFFLVVGPVGVPVNVLIEESGNDITLLCRGAALRMLDALQKVRGNRGGLRNECANALQKLAGMCKGDTIMSGLGGPVALSRKNVLKQIWDSITKACNAMASGVQI